MERVRKVCKSYFEILILMLKEDNLYILWIFDLEVMDLIILFFFDKFMMFLIFMLIFLVIGYYGEVMVIF